MPVVDRSTQNAKLTVPTSKWLVVIGANTGGPQALLNLLPKLPADFPGTIIVIQQMRPGFTRVLVDQLSYVCKLPVYEPEDGQALQPGRILVAPANSRLSI
jgi:two-component system chemotaxis response regulator CheB